MRLQAKGAPDATDRALAQATAAGHRARTPVGGVARFRLQRERHHVLHGGIGDAARCSRTRFIQQPVEARGQKPTAPLADGLLGQPQLVRDARVGLAARARQHDARSLRQRRSTSCRCST